MKKLPILAVAAGLTLSPLAPAVATPTPPPPLAEHMNDDQDGVWDKLQAWLESWHDAQHADPTPEPTPDPTETTTPAPDGPRVVESFAAATSENTMLFRGKIAGYPADQEFTFRSSAYELTDQAGYPVQGTADADGNLELEATDFNDTDPRYWQLEAGGTTWEHGEVIAEGELSDLTDAPIEEPIETPAPSEPAEEPGTDGGTTGGTGGELTNREDVPFTSNGMTSLYHVYAEGIDPSKPVGLMFYGDGSGGFGIDNPNSTYLLDADGSNGLVAEMRARNVILVVPEAPAPGCDRDDNCWYNTSSTPDAEAKARWSSDLMTHIKGQYDIDLDRIAVGGYSSGAQWTTRWFLPNHGEEQSVDLAVAISYGGTPYDLPAEFSDEYKASTVVVFNTGTSDSAYGTDSWEARGGEQWYREAGFTTDPTWPQGVRHGRAPGGDGVFDDIVAQAFDEHILN